MGSSRIENKDSSEFTLQIKVSGSGSSIKIPKGTTTVSWNGGSHDAIVQSGGVKFPDGKLVDGTNYRISGGVATKN